MFDKDPDFLFERQFDKTFNSVRRLAWLVFAAYIVFWAAVGSVGVLVLRHYGIL